MATKTQLDWLKLAGKNRKKTGISKKKLMEDFDKFVRRRDKVDVLLSGIAYVPGSPRSQLNQLIKEADAAAEAGNFSEAYRQLEAVKKMAKTYIKGFPESEVGQSLTAKLEEIHTSFLSRAELVDQLEAMVRNTMKELARLPKMSEAETFDEACNRAELITRHERELRARFFELNATQSILETYCNINQGHLHDQQVAIEAYKLAGQGDRIRDQDARAQELQTILDQYSDRFKLGPYKKLVAQANLEFELAIRDIKDMSWARELYERENKDGDALSIEAMSGLNPSSDDMRAALLEREQKTLTWAQEEYLKHQKKIDTGTDRDQVTPAVEMQVFHAADVFDDLLQPEEILSGKYGDYVELSEKRFNEIKKSAADQLLHYLNGVDVTGDEFFQLMTWQSAEFTECLRDELFDGSTVTTVNKFCTDIGAALNEVVYNLCPDQMSTDGKNLTFGGVDYVLDKVLKAGGNGLASRYRDPVTGYSVVVKTPAKSTTSEAVTHELLCHRRLMNNIDPSERDASRLVGLEGVARSPDGGIHIILEDVPGGDLEDIASTMSVLSDTGLLPQTARQILMCDVIFNTAQAMKEMEAAGLVHGDMKGENVMVTADGRIKIIDFGESDFVDETGGGARTRGMTAGYVSPDTRLDDGMDARADTFALGGMIQKLVLADRPTDDRTYSAGSLGKLIASLKEPDRENRPSLEAVMYNVLLASGAQDYDPADIEALKEATAGMAAIASGAKVSLTQDEIAENLPFFGSEVEAGEISLRKLTDFKTALESKIVKERSQAEGDDEAYLTTAKPKVSAYKKEISFLNGKVRDAFAIMTAEAEQAYEAAIVDPQILVHLVLPGQSKDVPLPRVLAQRAQMVAKLEEIRGLFDQAFSQADDPDLENAQVQSRRLEKGEANLRMVDDAIYAAVGPEARVFLNQKKLENIAKVFAH